MEDPVPRLEELLGEYPEISSPDFQTLISAKKEFSDLATPVGFRPTASDEGGRLFPHQLLFMRYLRFYSELLYIADTGTGKSCSLVALMEYFKHHREHIHHAYFFTGRTQRADFRKQLVCICTPRAEYRDKLPPDQKERAQEKMVTNLIKPSYTVTTYYSFVSRYFEPMAGVQPRARKPGAKPKVSEVLHTDEEIRQKFSGCIFFLDEIQLLKIDPQALTPARLHNYIQIWRMLHLVDRSIKIVASARPIVNRLTEFVFLMNLILPLDQQLYHPLMDKITRRAGLEARYPDRQLDLRQVSLEQLRPYLEGRVMYFKAFQTGAVPSYPPPTQFYLDIHGQEHRAVLYLRYLEMRTRRPSQEERDRGVTQPQPGLQLQAYRRAQREEATVDVFNPRLTREDYDNLYIGQRHAANFVFPNGGWDLRDFDEFVRVRVEDKVVTRIRAQPRLQHYLSQRGGLAQLSTKCHYIAKQVASDDTENELGPLGKHYVYTSFVHHGGAMMVGLALQYGDPDSPNPEGNSFELFNQKKSVFEVSGRVRPYCGTQATIKPEFRRKLRYAIIYGENKDCHRAIFELFNSKENLLGEYLKVIIVSRVGQIGINLADCLHEYLLEPDWSPSTIYQSDKRIFRATSHINILEYLQRQRTLSGRAGPVTVRVKVNYLAIRDPQHPDLNTVDEIIYQAAQYKDFDILGLIRKAKQLSVDCQIQAAHNYRPEYQDGSAECDYQSCRYACADPIAVPGSDTQTFDVYYADALVEEIIEKVIRYHFRRESTATAEQLLALAERLPGAPRISKAKYLYLAFEKLIREQITLYDRFGFEAYLLEDGAIFYLSRIYPRNAPNSTYLASYYNSNLLALKTESLSAVNLRITLDQLEQLQQQLRFSIASSASFWTAYDSLRPPERAVLLDDLWLTEPTPEELEYHQLLLRRLEEELRNREGRRGLPSPEVAAGIWQRFHQQLTAGKEFQTLLDGLTNAQQTALLEGSLLQVLRQPGLLRVGVGAPSTGAAQLRGAAAPDRETSPGVYVKAILEKFKPLFARINKPTAAIRNVILAAARPTRTGRQTGPEISFTEGYDPNLITVYLHRLYNPRVQVAKHGISAKFSNVEGVIRIIELAPETLAQLRQPGGLPPELEWRDALSYESQVYKEYFRRQLAVKNARFQENEIYGKIIGKEIQIVDNRGKFTKKQKKMKVPGRVCTSFNEYALIDKMFYLGIPYPADDELVDEVRAMSRSEVIQAMYQAKKGKITIDKKDYPLEEMSTAQLHYYYYWLKRHVSSRGNGRHPRKASLCQLIFEYLIRHNLVETTTDGRPAAEQFRDIITRDSEIGEMAFQAGTEALLRAGEPDLDTEYE